MFKNFAYQLDLDNKSDGSNKGNFDAQKEEKSR
jgi:hypothetical protein